MRENELAGLLIQMGADRGVDVEAAADELASIALPSFVDARAFRSAVVQALEAHLRAQMEQRLLSIRKRFDVDKPQRDVAQPQQRFAPPFAEPSQDAETSGVAMDGQPNPADDTFTDLAPVVPAAETPETPALAEEEELPTDATMVWTTRHG
ncbi:MAG: hypothetical protein WEC79_08285 [Thermomicrobiales bacterium]